VNNQTDVEIRRERRELVHKTRRGDIGAENTDVHATGADLGGGGFQDVLAACNEYKVHATTCQSLRPRPSDALRTARDHGPRTVPRRELEPAALLHVSPSSLGYFVKI
jgi:hypothetical protein